MLLSAFLFEFYFLPPAGHIIHTKAAFLRLAFFIGAMVLTAVMIEARRRSERDRLRMEESLRQTQSKLAQATQIATAAELAASIVHEISQPLSAMVANGQACLRWLGTTPPNYVDGQAAVERIVRDGKDAAGIIKGLRSLFGRAALDKSELDLREIVEEVVALLRGKAEHERVLLDVQMSENLPHIMGDKIQLQQVLMNLVTNGIESMQTVVDRPRRLTIRASQRNNQILTSVEDQGIGVENFDAIFDAFFTTKEKGMGMGLAICRSIIEVHEGKLSGVARPAGGSVFSFTLPHLGENKP
jgi:C4-dicarboxylate-specific signal transduction histidine kinase